MVPLSCGTNNTVGLAVYETGNATFTTICAFAEYSPPWLYTPTANQLHPEDAL